MQAAGDRDSMKLIHRHVARGFGRAWACPASRESNCRCEPAHNQGSKTRRIPHLRFVEQGGVEELQLGAERLVVTNGVRRGAVDDVDERASSLTVAQELVAQADARVRALQQPCSYRRVRGARGKKAMPQLGSAALCQTVKATKMCRTKHQQTAVQCDRSTAAPLVTAP